jgi:L-threonylcarbamoyladenylate synthase
VRPRLVPDDADGRAAAIDVLRAGGVVALPTDTVYGLTASLAVPGAVARLFEVKRRPVERGILLLLADEAQAARIAVLTPAAAALADAFWPGGLTMVLRQLAGVSLPVELTGGARTVGLRVPNHPAPRTLAAAIGPLPTTSANLSGMPEASEADEIIRQLGDGIDLVLDGGPAAGGRPSSVVDCSTEPPRLLRSGAIPTEQIAAVLARVGMGLET